jgi:hypothetical protein
MLIDLIAANPEDAQAILSTPGHANVWPTLEAKSVDRVKLATLALILKGQPPEGEPFTAYVQSFENLVTASDEGPWIDVVPDALAEDLAILSEERIRPIARAWADTKEARLDRWSADETEPFLKELSAFAASARAQEKKLLLWVCL